MILSPDGLYLLLQQALLLSVFIGPEYNATQMVPFEKKMDALTLFQRTGDASEYNAVIASIRTRKVEAEDTLRIYLKGKKQLEDGIANDFELLQKARPREALGLQKTIDASMRSLETDNYHVARLTAVIEGRVQEERLFTAFYEVIKAERARRKAP
jgi:hypothetical protein